jgi:hypothetical protein
MKPDLPTLTPLGREIPLHEILVGVPNQEKQKKN